MGVSVRNLVALVFIVASLPAAAGLLCYWCSGVGNDRECELRPDAVSTGPVFINCRQNHCVSTKVIDVATGRVQSFARFCDRVPRGNVCVRDSKLVTCYESCKDDLCNHGNPDPAYLPLVSYASYDVISRYSEHRVPSNGNDNVGNRILSAAAARQKIGWYGDENAESAASTRSRPFERPQLWREEEEHGGNALQVAPKASQTERVKSVVEPERISSSSPDFARSTMGSSSGFGFSNVRGQIFPTTEERPGARGNSVLIEEDAEEGTRSFDSSYGSPYRPPRYWSSNSRRFSRPFTRSQQSSLIAKDNSASEGSFQATTSGHTTTGQGAGFTKNNYFKDANSAVNTVEKADENKLQGLSKDGAFTTATEQIHRMMTRQPFVERRRNKNRRLKVAASRRRPERVQAPKANGMEKSTTDLKNFNKHKESRLPTEAIGPIAPSSTVASTTTTTTSTTSTTTATTTMSTQVSTMTTRNANVAPTEFHTATSTNKDKKTSIPTSASAPVSPDAHASKTKSSSHKDFRSPYAPPETDSNRYQVGGQRAAPLATDDKKTPGKTNFKKAASTQEKIVVPAPSSSSASRGGKLPARKAQSTMRLTTAEQKTTVSLMSASEPSTAKAVGPREQNIPSPTTTTVKTTSQTMTTTTQRTTPSTIPTTTLFPVLHGFDIKGPEEYEEMARMKPWVRPLFHDLGSMLSQKALNVGEHKKEVEVNLPNSPAGKSVFLKGGDSKTHWDTKPSQSATASSNKATSPSSEPQSHSQTNTGVAEVPSRLHPSTQTVTTQTDSKTQNVPEIHTAAQERSRDVVKANSNTKDNSRNDNMMQKHGQVKNDGKEGTSKTPSIITHPVPSKPKHSPKINENQADRDFVQNPVSRRGPGGKDVKMATSRIIPTNTIDWQFYRKDLVGESKNVSAPLKRLQSHQSPETGVWYSGYSPSARFDGWTPHSHTREDTVTSTRAGFQKAESEKTSETSGRPGEDRHTEKKTETAEQAPKFGKVGNSDSSIITHPVRNINTTPTGGMSKSTTVTSPKSTTTEKARVNKDNKNEKKSEQKDNQLNTKSPQLKKADMNTVSDKKDPLTDSKKDVKATADMRKDDDKDSSSKTKEQEKSSTLEASGKNERKDKKSPFQPGRHYKRPRKVMHRGEKPKPTFQTKPVNKMESMARMTSVHGPVWTTKNTPRQGAEVHDKDFFRTSSGTAYPPRGPGQDGQLKSLPIFLTLDSKNDGKGTTSVGPQAGLPSQSADEKTFKKTEMKSPYAPRSNDLDVMAQRRATERTFVDHKVGIDNSRLFPSPASKKESSSAASVSKENQRPSVQTSTASGKISSSTGAKTESAAITKSMNDNNSSTGKSLAASTSTAVSDAPKDKVVAVEKALKSPYERPTWTNQYEFTVSATKTAATKPGPQKTSSASSQNTFSAATTEARIPTPVTAIQASRAGSTSKSDRGTVTSPFSPDLDWQKQKTTSVHTHQVKTTPSSKTDSKPPSFTPKVLISKQQRPGIDLTHLHNDEREEVLRLIPNLKDDAIIWPREPKDVEERIISKVIVEEDAEEVLHQALPRKSAQGGESRSESRLEEIADQWAPSSQGLSGAKEGETEAEQGKGDANISPSSADPSNGQPPLFTGTVNTTLGLENTRKHSPPGDSNEISPFDFSSASSLRFLWSLLVSSLAVLVLL